MRRAIHSPASLPAGATADTAASDFSMKMPRAWLDKADTADPSDPLLRQVLPDARECTPVAGFRKDPTGDLRSSPTPGVVRKYRDRALLIVTGACAIHCRYCFRRHFPYGGHATEKDIRRALEYIAEQRDISEVILSGGDPLTLGNERLFAIGSAIEAIPHVRRIRIHTRVPVVVPSRMDNALSAWLNERVRRCVVVLHINHANEIGDDTADALSGLRTPLFNQSVLLKGVNDECDALCDLSLACFSVGIIPYYLHQLDRVAGAAHFAVSDTRARALHAEMRSRLPGYLVPRLIREDPTTAQKVPLI